MHTHPIIHQDPSAKPAGLFGVTSRPFILLQVEADIEVLRVKPTVLGCLSSHCLAAVLLGGFLVELWVYSSCSTTTNLEKRWSASSFLSMYSSIFAWRLIETCNTFSSKIASTSGWEGNILVVAKGKKGRSGGKIEPKERRAKAEVCKTLSW